MLRTTSDVCTIVASVSSAAAVGPPRRVRRVTRVRPRAMAVSCRRPPSSPASSSWSTSLPPSSTAPGCGSRPEWSASPPAPPARSRQRPCEQRTSGAISPNAAHDGFTWFFIVAVSIGAALSLASAPPAVGSRRVARGAAARLLPDDVGAVVAGRRARRRPGVLGDRGDDRSARGSRPLRWRPRICFGLIAAATALVLVGDAVHGGTLELDAPFGNSPTVAGRFSGIGNIAFGFSMGAILVGLRARAALGSPAGDALGGGGVRGVRDRRARRCSPTRSGSCRCGSPRPACSSCRRPPDGFARGPC